MLDDDRKKLDTHKSPDNKICARRMLHDRVQLRIMWGDILTEEADAHVFPADPDLRFKIDSIEKIYKIQIEHLFGMYKIYPDRRVVKYDKLPLPNASKVYFCAIPTWTGVLLFNERNYQKEMSLVIS